MEQACTGPKGSRRGKPCANGCDRPRRWRSRRIRSIGSSARVSGREAQSVAPKGRQDPEHELDDAIAHPGAPVHTVAPRVPRRHPGRALRLLGSAGTRRGPHHWAPQRGSGWQIGYADRRRRASASRSANPLAFYGRYFFTVGARGVSTCPQSLPIVTWSYVTRRVAGLILHHQIRMHRCALGRSTLWWMIWPNTPVFESRMGGPVAPYKRRALG